MIFLINHLSLRSSQSYLSNMFMLIFKNNIIVVLKQFKFGSFNCLHIKHIIIITVQLQLTCLHNSDILDDFKKLTYDILVYVSWICVFTLIKTVGILKQFFITYQKIPFTTCKKIFCHIQRKMNYL